MIEKVIHITTFIIGFLFGMIGVNIVASLSELITTSLDAIRAKINVKIAKYGAEIKKLGEQEEQSSVHAIGFTIPEEVEYYEDEDGEND